VSSYAKDHMSVDMSMSDELPRDPYGRYEATVTYPRNQTGDR